MTAFLNQEDGYYSLTTAGAAAIFIAIAALIVVIALLRRTPQKREAEEAGALREGADARGADGAGGAGYGTAQSVAGTGGAERTRAVFSTRQLVFSALSLALAFALSYVRIIPMPWGGSVTLCSMLFVTLIGYWYGPRIGLTASFAYSLLEFVQDGGSYILSPLQACFDYIFAFTALGVSGFFSGRKNGLRNGYLVAILLRGLFHTIGGYLYWMDYMPESFPKSLAAIYPFCYNYAYILLEGVLTIVLISLPPIARALARVRVLATQE